MDRRDEGLERLVDLDGFVAEVGGGFWVKFVAQRVPPGAEHPHGVNYSLTLHDPGGQRLFGIDNAHLVRITRGPASRSAAVRDHLHRGESVRAYEYHGAGALLEDFWREVAALLKRGRCGMKKTLRIGIAPREAIIRYTRDLVAGRRQRTVDDPDIWFTSVESFAKVLSERNRALLALIVQRQPESLDALAEASGRAKSNLSRTLHTMARYGLVRLEQRAGRKVRPVVTFHEVELKLALAA